MAKRSAAAAAATAAAAVVVLLSWACVALAGESGSVCWSSTEDSLTFQAKGCSAEADVVVARAAFVDARSTPSNFGKLRVVANDSDTAPALVRYRAAGFAEGWLTAERIWHHSLNMQHYFSTQLYPDVDLWDKPMRWLEAQEAWVRQAIADAKSKQVPSGSTDPAPPQQELGVLGATELLLAQFDGLVEGYAARAAHEGRLRAAGAPAALDIQPLSRQQHLFMQNNGELYDIVDGMVAGVVDVPPGNASSNGASSGSSSIWKAGTSAERRAAAAARRAVRVGAGGGEAPARQSAAEWLRRVITAPERCSALIKVNGDLSDIFVAHATWDSFTNALHIFKHYEFGAPGFGRLSFSSYPGETFSDDDFYLSESGLIVTETTMHIFNPAIFSALSVESLLSWQRVRSALLLAGSGEQWVKAFSTLNSGTYNNEYMIIDLNRFKPKVELQPGLLWVVEQLPGLIVAADMTDTLAHGHWASYNVPAFPKVYNMSGYPDAAEAMRQDQSRGPNGEAKLYELPISWLSYQSSPRAAIFRRDQGAVETLDDLKDIIRYNRYTKDKYSHGVAEASVCGRLDLPSLERLQAQQAQGQEAEGTSSSSSSRRLFAHAPGRLVPGSGKARRSGGGAEGGAGVSGAALHPEAIPSGCYDGKVTSYKLARQLLSEVVNGPTTSNGLPAFSWADWDAAGEYMHVGHPETFNFTFERMAAEELPL